MPVSAGKLVGADRPNEPPPRRSFGRAAQVIEQLAIGDAQRGEPPSGSRRPSFTASGRVLPDSVDARVYERSRPVERSRHVIASTRWSTAPRVSTPTSRAPAAPPQVPDAFHGLNFEEQRGTSWVPLEPRPAEDHVVEAVLQRWWEYSEIGLVLTSTTG